MVHHRYHPEIIAAFKELRHADPAFFFSLFKSNRDMGLYLAAIERATVHVIRKKSIASGRRAPGKRKNPSIEFYGRFPGEFMSFFRNESAGRHALVAAKRIGTRKREASKNTKSPWKPRDDGDEKKTGSTPCFMLANHAVWASGVLNKPGRHVGNTFDLATIEGFVFLMHEIFHTMQWYRSPVKFLLGYLAALVRSLSISNGHIPWAHEVIGFEVEAIAFHERLWDWLEHHASTRGILARFRELY